VRQAEREAIHAEKEATTKVEEKEGRREANDTIRDASGSS
jgi:hypothetical protein